MKRALGIGAAIGASGLAVASLAALKWYVFDIVIGQAGEADRSMLFWGIPILLLGLAAGMAAIGLAIASYRAFTTSLQ